MKVSVLRLALTLLLITSVTAAALAGVNALTGPVIARRTQEQTQAAIQAVLPGGSDREITDFTYLFLLTWASARMTRRK